MSRRCMHGNLYNDTSSVVIVLQWYFKSDVTGESKRRGKSDHSVVAPLSEGKREDRDRARQDTDRNGPLDPSDRSHAPLKANGGTTHI